MPSDVDVLVVGAGPTGLVHALWLARAGVRVRIIDKAAEPGTASRAVGVAARTLELYRQLGIADEVVAEGWPCPAVNFWVRGEKIGHIEMRTLGEGLSPYPFELMYPQGKHERLLIRALAAAGVTVERPRSLVSLAQDETGVTAQLDNGTVCRARYVTGCDGAHSTVRTALDITLPGATYSHLFFVADLDATGPSMNGELHISLDTSAFLAAFPLAVGRARVIGTTDDTTKTWEDVAEAATKRLGLADTQVRDFSCYHVHHRVAGQFRIDRVFLCGDAAHLHSPAGAQGMNTGIGDAINLAWKLAEVIRGAPVTLLDSFEPERRGFAEQLVKTTDFIFQFAAREGAIAEFIRTRVAPHAIHAVLGFAATRKTAFRLLGQLEISYRHSPMSEGFAAGERLPWAGDNYDLLNRAWQVHVYGEASAELRACGLPVHVVPWTDAADHAGLKRDAVYLIRPDGYIAWSDEDASVDDLAGYRARFGI